MQSSIAPHIHVGLMMDGNGRWALRRGLPRGIADSDERLATRELKYPLICHAEENAIMHAARIGISLKDCSAYVTWPPCTRCARSLIQAGVKTVLYPDGLEIPERWQDDFDMSTTMFREAGIEIRPVSPEKPRGA